MYRDNIGLLLWGNVGAGKTYFAACVANALIDLGNPVLMTSFVKIINAMSSFRVDRNEYIRDLNKYKLLVIDDLGAERQNDSAQEIVYTVIDERCKNRQPLIVTTNLTLDEIKNPRQVSSLSAMVHKRIYDRILEMCVPIQLKADSRRKYIRQGKISEFESMLADL